MVKGIKESNIPATNVQIQLYNTTETSTLNTGEIYKTFNLEVKNEIEEMGTAIFEIDQRAFNKKKRYYMISNGKQVAGMNNLKYPYQSKEYKDMVNIGWFENEGELFRSNTKFDSSHVIYIKNGDRKLSEGYVRELGDYNYSTFAINSIATADIVFPRVEYSKLKELLVTYCVDETKPSHNYSFLFLIDGKKYSGSIKNQKYTANTSSKASIDLFYLRDTETTFVFPAKGIGEVESFNSGKDGENLKMKIASGAIPNPFGAIPSYDSKIIANKIKITNIKINGNLKASNSSLDNGNLKEKVENYEIGIDLRTGGLTLRKLDLRRPTQERVEFTLTYYYEPPKVSDGIVPDGALTGDAIAMDSIELTINDTTESIGSTKFEIDKRLGQINGEWLFPDGVLKASSGEKLGKYTKMLGVSSQYSNMLESDETKVTDVLLINENEDLSESIDYNGKKYKYEKDRGLNKIFLPFGNNVKLSSYKTGADSLLMVSIADIQVEAKEVLETRLKNSFLIRTENQHYLGEIEENYVGSGVYKGSGSIDLTTLKANGMKYTFIPDVISKLQEDIRDVPAKETSRVAITEISGNFVDGRGVAGTNRGVNIANKIKVEKISNEKSITEDMAISENGELSVTLDNITFGIDEASGGLTISKNNNTKLKQVKISYYYSPEDITLTRSVTEKDVLLGEFTLNIEDLDVEIDGDGTLDFGNLAYTEEHKKQTREERYRIKNLDNKKVSFGVSKENGEMYLTSDGTPGAIKENDENSSKISLTNISVEQAGNYSGEIEVTVTLDEKK